MELTALNPIQQMAVADLFEDCNQVIQTTCRAFVRKHGGNLIDALGESHLLFLKAWSAYREPDKRRGTGFDSHLRYWLWYGLVDVYRKGGTGRVNVGRPFTGSEKALLQVESSRVKPLDDVLQALSTDGRYVAGLAIDPPKWVAQMAQRKGGKPRNYRSVIREYLEVKGWDRLRCNAAFEEIRKAL